MSKETLFNYSQSLRPDTSYPHPLYKRGCYVTQKRALSRAKKSSCAFLTKRRYYKGKIKVSYLSKFYLKSKMVWYNQGKLFCIDGFTNTDDVTIQEAFLT